MRDGIEGSCVKNAMDSFFYFCNFKSVIIFLSKYYLHSGQYCRNLFITKEGGILESMQEKE